VTFGVTFGFQRSNSLFKGHNPAGFSPLVKLNSRRSRLHVRRLVPSSGHVPARRSAPDIGSRAALPCLQVIPFSSGGNPTTAAGISSGR